MKNNEEEYGYNSRSGNVNGGSQGLGIVRIIGRKETQSHAAISVCSPCSHDSDGSSPVSEFEDVNLRNYRQIPPDDGSLYFLARELDCPHCSSLIVADLQSLPYLADASYNLLTRTLVLKPKSPKSIPDDIESTVSEIIHRYEPDVTVVPLSDGHESISTDEKEDTIFGVSLKIRLIIGLAVFALGLGLYYGFAELSGVRITACILLLVSYLAAGADVLLDAVRKIKTSPFSEQMLMTVASLGAVAIGEYPEAAAVMIFYQVGEYFQDRAVNHSRASIRALLDICPDKASLQTDDGIVEVRASDVRIGDRVVVRPGEKVPCDGVVISGHAGMDTSNLTGESVPRSVSEGSEVYSGFISRDGVIEVEVRKKADDSAASEIIRMVEKAGERKSRTENFISVFAKYYTPSVVALAVLTALIPPLLFGEMWSVWIERALIFLVVSCPCALVISIPLTYFSGIGAASGRGIMVKGSNYLDALGKAGVVFFDKTGTLTRGTFRLSSITGSGIMSDDELLRLVASAENGSAHPIARSVTEAAEKRGLSLLNISDFQEISGRGIRAVADGKTVLAGNDRLLKDENISVPDISAVGTVIHVAADGVYAGTLVVADEIREDSSAAVDKLSKMGISCVMLTGDNDSIAASVAGHVGISEYHASLFPADKVSLVEKSLKKIHEKNRTAVFVGDGINDAPALALADVGIAMGAMGSDAAIEAADAVIMSDEPRKLVTGIGIARKTGTIVRQNIVLALAVKFLLMILGAMGIVGMWFAVFGDVGVMILAVLNSMRMIFNRRSA